MLDRSQAPQTHSLTGISLPEIDSFTNSKGVNIHFHQTPGTGTFKLELYSRGSQLHARNAAECQLSLKMLREGTKTKSAKEFAEEVDGIGSFLEINPGFDRSSITIFGLSQYFGSNINLLNELIDSPRFKESSLDKLKLKETNRLKQNLEKGSYLSSINLRNALFGLEHPYGHILTLEDISALTINDVSHFHDRFVRSFEIYISGDISKEDLNHLESFISTNTITTVDYDNDSLIIEDSIIRSSKFVQSSIKIGKKLFNRTHQDYFPFIVTNEILGGYFGSRLMKNIREEKGLTYGIYSHLYALEHGGYFLISSDVKGENEKEAIEEIFKEITVLQQELISEEELNTVKNYMIGTFANSLSSPFGIIEKHKIILSHELSKEFYDHYIDSIQEVTEQDVIDMATTYLKSDTFTKSIVGN